MAEFTMPSLGSDMDAGVLAAWTKNVGDRVRRGDIIAEVETDKGIIEVEVFNDGVIEQLLIEPGTKVPVGTPLATIREEPSSAVPEESPRGRAASIEPQATPEAGKPAEALGNALREGDVSSSVSRTRATPAARRRARDLGIDLPSLVGTGPHGTIDLADVEGAARQLHVVSPTSAPESAKIRMRQAIASAMARSKREIPHYYVATTVDLSRALGWLEERNRSVAPPGRLIPAVLFVKAVALALEGFPELNSRWEVDHAAENVDINVGAAIRLRGGGLVAPALSNTNKAPIGELMGRFRDLVLRARKGALRSSEFTSATITVTSLGERGTETVYGVIYPPQVAIVGFGTIVRRPWVVGDTVTPRPVVHITLAADHRVTDGHSGALFLDAVSNLLQEPETL